jgi:hypothetical protein
MFIGVFLSTSVLHKKMAARLGKARKGVGERRRSLRERSGAGMLSLSIKVAVDP